MIPGEKINHKVSNDMQPDNNIFLCAKDFNAELRFLTKISALNLASLFKLRAFNASYCQLITLSIPKGKENRNLYSEIALYPCLSFQSVTKNKIFFFK